MQDRNGIVSRVALAIPEQRRDLDLSLRELERLSGVSRWTLSRIERGEPANPTLVVRVAATLNVLELAATPNPGPVDVLDELVSPVRFRPAALLWRRKPTLAQPSRPTLGGAA